MRKSMVSVVAGLVLAGVLPVDSWAAEAISIVVSPGLYPYPIVFAPNLGNTSPMWFLTVDTAPAYQHVPNTQSPNSTPWSCINNSPTRCTFVRPAVYLYNSENGFVQRFDGDLLVSVGPVIGGLGGGGNSHWDADGDFYGDLNVWPLLTVVTVGNPVSLYTTARKKDGALESVESMWEVSDTAGVVPTYTAGPLATLTLDATHGSSIINTPGIYNVTARYGELVDGLFVHAQVVVLRVELDEATFQGTGNHLLKNDDGTYISDGIGNVRVPQIKSGASPKETEICYTWESSPEIVAKFSIVPVLTIPVSAKIRIEGVQRGRAGTLVYEKSVSLSGSSVTVTFTTSDKLKRLVDNTTYDLTWKLSTDGGGTYRTIAATANKLFVVAPGNTGVARTVKRMDWACSTAISEDSIGGAALKFRHTVLTTVGFNGFWSDITYPWVHLDTPIVGADCISLAALAVEGLKQVGFPAEIDYAWPSSDTTATVGTCRGSASTTDFEYMGQMFHAVLHCDVGRYEGFFKVVDGGSTRAYNVSPEWGPSQTQYYYLEIMRNTAGNQYWVWNGDQTVNGVSVVNEQRVRDNDGALLPNVPLPALP